ncbi:MAG TPA: hypothetical protein VHV75_12060 [Solirubrobacteraceae bacterium]|jgi:threonine dehydrogenase-like Zn-dependent dehydrogenase|nr:hypothetical protein [Solirubrobacteraceae bacterium]
MGRRRTGVLGCLAVLAASSVIASSATATQAHPTTRAHAAPHTTAPDLFVTVRVTITNDKFIVSKHSGPRGADAKFVMHNISNKPHNFSLGREDYGTGTQTGFTVTLKPGQRTIKILYLDVRGTLRYFPGLAADKGKKGMQGVFKIGPCTDYEQNTGVGDC